MPSHDTFGRVFAALDPRAFAEGFTAWVQTLVSDWSDDIVAIDGKTMRRSLDKANGKAAYAHRCRSRFRTVADRSWMRISDRSHANMQ
nr:hypothetical protein [Salmonella sp. SG203]